MANDKDDATIRKEDYVDVLSGDQIDRISKLLAEAEALRERVNRLTNNYAVNPNCDNSDVNSCCDDVDCSMSDTETNDKNRVTLFADELTKPTLRPIFTMKPGIPAYRNDPVKRYELYQKEWLKYPTPGEDKRLPLRWKVREYMLRQDAPAKMN